MAKQQPGKTEKKRIDLSFIDIELQNNDKVKALFTEAGIDATDRDGRTLLLNASCYNNIELAGWAINSGANINHQDNNGWSALHFAVQAQNFAIAELLLQNNITVDIQDVYGNTALWRGVNTNVDFEIIQLLIRNGANPGLQNFNEIAPADLISDTDENSSRISDLISHTR